MKFSSLFYNSRINLGAINRKRFVLSVCLGITSAVIIYSFFFVLVETFRVMGLGYDGLPQIISETDRRYYNTFFAALSLVFGNSIAINFLFSKPQSVTHRFNPKRKRLLNDNIFLSFNFSYWFAKLGLSFGIFSMCCLKFEMLPFFKPFSFLLVLVLYLESTKNLNFFFRNKARFKFILIHSSILAALTFGLREINIIDYKSIDNAMLFNDPLIDLPETTYLGQKRNFSRPSIYFKMKADSTGYSYLYYQKGKLEIEEARYVFPTHTREELERFMVIQLDADKHCSIYDIKRLEKSVLQSNRYHMFYIIDLIGHDQFMFEPIGITKRISPSVLDLKDRIISPPPPPIPFKDWVDPVIKDTLFISIGNNITINNEVVKRTSLQTVFKQHYDLETLFLYQYLKEGTYQDYIDVLSAHKEVIRELKVQDQTIFEKPGFIPSSEYSKEQSELNFKYPLKIAEEFLDN